MWGQTTHEEPVGIAAAGFLQAGCTSRHQSNSVKALKNHYSNTINLKYNQWTKGLLALAYKCSDNFQIQQSNGAETRSNQRKLRTTDKVWQTLKLRRDRNHGTREPDVESVCSMSRKCQPQMMEHNLPDLPCNDNRTCPGMQAVLAAVSQLKTGTNILTSISHV